MQGRQSSCAGFGRPVRPTGSPKAPPRARPPSFRPKEGTHLAGSSLAFCSPSHSRASCSHPYPAQQPFDRRASRAGPNEGAGRDAREAASPASETPAGGHDQVIFVGAAKGTRGGCAGLGGGRDTRNWPHVVAMGRVGTRRAVSPWLVYRSGDSEGGRESVSESGRANERARGSASK
jgi:hypothetical protein